MEGQFSMEIATLHLDVHAGFTSGGSLVKTWSSDRQWLYKGASSVDTQIRICSEYICSQLAEALALHHVTYEWLEDKYQICDSPDVLNLGLVKCHNFISNGDQFISFNEIFKQQSKSLSEALYAFASEYTDDFCRMLLFDYLVANTDRHHKNFGVLTHIDGTHEMAPLFDHDWAMFPEWCEGSFVFDQVVGTVREKTYLETLDDLPRHILELHANPLSLADWETFEDKRDSIIAACPRLSLKRKVCISNMLTLRLEKLKKMLGG